MIRIEPGYARFFPETRLEAFFAIRGAVARKVKRRWILRFERDGQGFYIKCHDGTGWREILKNLLALRLPVIGARQEWAAIRFLQDHGIATMTPVALGIEGSNPSSQRSFIITADLGRTMSLEDLTMDWPNTPPTRRLKQALLRELARISRVIHDNGFNHRDFYLCHFLLDQNPGAPDPDSAPRLFLIDLHRAQIRATTPYRWRVKDVGSLYFSAMRIGLTRRDLLRFMALYTGKPWRQTLSEDGRFWQAVRARADALYFKMWRSAAPHLL